MINLTDDFQKELDAKVAEAQQAKAEEQRELLSTALQNPSFIEAQRSIAAKKAELSKLQSIIKQLNAIKPFQASDGSTYNVNVYPVNIFGAGMAEVMGIIIGSRSAFTDDLAIAYEAISDLSIVELLEAREALGQPAYFSKGETQPAVDGNYSKFKPLLDSICLKLGLFEYNPSSVTKDKIDLWFAKSEITANNKLKEFEKSKDLDSSQTFTIED